MAVLVRHQLHGQWRMDPVALWILQRFFTLTSHLSTNRPNGAHGSYAHDARSPRPTRGKLLCSRCLQLEQGNLVPVVKDSGSTFAPPRSDLHGQVRWAFGEGRRREMAK